MQKEGAGTGKISRALLEAPSQASARVPTWHGVLGMSSS